MASSDPSAKRGRREDDDDEIRRRRKLTIKEKGKEPVAPKEKEKKEADDISFAVELLQGTFMKLRDVGEAFKIEAPDHNKHDSVKGLAFRIHVLAGKLEKLPVVQRSLLGDDDGSDGGDDDDSDSGDDSSDGGTPTAATD